VGRTLRTDIFRPDCPDGQAGAIHIPHYSSWTPEHEKIQYACMPKGGKRHKFTMAMPSRQRTANHPLGGQSCQECERPTSKDSPPPVAISSCSPPTISCTTSWACAQAPGGTLKHTISEFLLGLG
jgi:hypothetical protein